MAIEFKKYASKFNISMLAAIMTIVVGILACYQFIFKSPQEKLQDMGIPWTAENFMDSVRLNNTKAVGYFLEGGMSPYAPNQKGYIAGQLCFVDNQPEKMLQTIFDNFKDFDVNKTYKTFPFPEISLMSTALALENLPLIKALVKFGVDPNKKLKVTYDIFTPGGTTFEDTPLNFIKGKNLKYKETEKRKQIALFLKEVAPDSDREHPEKAMSNLEMENEMEKFQQNTSRKAMQMLQNGGIIRQ